MPLTGSRKPGTAALSGHLAIPRASCQRLSMDVFSLNIFDAAVGTELTSIRSKSQTFAVDVRMLERRPSSVAGIATRFTPV